MLQFIAHQSHSVPESELSCTGCRRFVLSQSQYLGFGTSTFQVNGQVRVMTHVLSLQTGIFETPVS